MCDYNDYKEIERTITDNGLSFQKIDTVTTKSVSYKGYTTLSLSETLAHYG